MLTLDEINKQSKTSTNILPYEKSKGRDEPKQQNISHHLACFTNHKLTSMHMITQKKRNFAAR